MNKYTRLAFINGIIFVATVALPSAFAFIDFMDKMGFAVFHKSEVPSSGLPGSHEPSYFIYIATVVVFALMILLFFYIEYKKAVEYSNATKKGLVGVALSETEALYHTFRENIATIKNTNPGFEPFFRSNIFVKKTRITEQGKANGYEILFQYGMDKFEDKSIVIPENMGVTGRVFNTNADVFARQADLKAGINGLPSWVRNSAPASLEWIYSQPLKTRNGHVEMTLSIDSNVPCNQAEEVIVKTLSTKIKQDLAQMLSDFK